MHSRHSLRCWVCAALFAGLAQTACDPSPTHTLVDTDELPDDPADGVDLEVDDVDGASPDTPASDTADADPDTIAATDTRPTTDADPDTGGDVVETFDDSPLYEPLGGAATVDFREGQPFGSLLTELPLEDYAQASRGRELFVADWEPGDTGRELLNGLGPHFHVASCLACHPAAGRPPTWLPDGAVGPGILFRLRRVEHETVVGDDPVYGGQLQPGAIAGLPPEATLRWYPDDELAMLPPDAEVIPVGPGRVATFESPAYGALDDATRVGPRLSPHLAGMGLLDHVPDAEILAWADPDDRDGDGISGRPHEHVDAAGDVRLGRYGWKANAVTLREQVAGAFLGDMGLTSSVHPVDDCTVSQAACQASPHGGMPEVSDEGLDAVVAYLQVLGVPRRVSVDAALEGEGLRVFTEVGCASCHRATLETAPDAGLAVLSGQRIHPFTDLLLHDMGASLSDGLPDGSASDREWRTPPLWGIGRVAQQPHARFLHDGRAGSLDEAIREHAGEAAASAAAYAERTSAERKALLAFLHSL